MIALLCVLIVLGSSRCDELPSRFEVESSINRTIDEVERLIRQDSTLPRLSRREIVDILFNITSKDLETYKNKETIERARKIYQRALMVVLPYSAEDAKGNLKDLYTKPPIVQIIADPSDPRDPEGRESTLPPPQWSAQDTRSDKEEALENLVVTHVSEKTAPKGSSYAKAPYKNHRETYTEVRTKVPLKETIKLDSAPMKFSFNLENLQRQTTTERAASTRRPVFQAPSSTEEEVYIVYSTSATTAPTVGTSPGFDVNEPRTSAPSKYNQNVLSSNQWRYNAPPSTTTLRSTTSASSSSEEIRDNEQSYSSAVSETPEDATTTDKVVDLIYVTPVLSSSSLTSVKSTYNLNSGGFRRITTTTTMRPEVMDLLASIGLRPENATKVEEVFKGGKEDLQKFQIPGSNGLLRSTASGLTAAVPDSPSIVAQNTFENPVSELGQGMNNLTPDVQLLFQRFGLQTSNLATTAVASVTPRPTVNTNSYTNFKPLPTSPIKDQDMKEFLARFGLGVSDHGRQRKAMPAPSSERPSLIEAVPDNMREILENIGLISRKTVKATEMARPAEASTQFHVFKPHEVRLQNEEQRTKINELLDTVKLVQEGKASVKDVRRVADDLLATTKSLKDGPDPLSLEEIIKVYNEDMKNEVKRQQGPIETIETTTDGDSANTTTTTTASTPSSLSTESVDVSTVIATTTVVPTTSSDSARNGSDTLTSSPESSSSTTTTTGTNLASLEESFGGTTRAPDPALPAKRKNGLYFLVDWNTFLEVGEGDERVNLRFQPKAGEKSRFLPINVP